MFGENNPLIKLFGIKYPILQAPMAIVTTPALAAAVARAGGLGSLGCAVLSPDEIRRQVDEFRRLTDRRHPIHLNFFTHSRPQRDEARERRAMDLVSPFYRQFGIGEVPEPFEPFLPFDESTLETILALRVEIVSFHFGLPTGETVRTLKKNGVCVLSSATTVQEAILLQQGGVDAVIAQGAEAGGHRGSFASEPGGGLVGSISLVPQIVDAIDVPVIAAGGIADGRGIGAALALGASGVQLGTAFLRSPEANVTTPHRLAIANSREDDTRVTRAFSGRPARSLRNVYLDRLAPHEGELPGFPLMNPLSKPLRVASDQAGVPDCLPLWAGQAFRLASEKSAGEIVQDLVAETLECAARLSFGRD